MKTQMIILVALMTGACATPFERCSTFNEDPFDLAETDILARNARLKALKAEKYSQMTDKDFVSFVAASTKVEWMRYGSMNACIASKNVEDQAAINNVAVGYNLGRDAVRNNQSETDGLNAHLAEFAKGRPAVVQPTEVNVYIRK